MNDRIKLAEAMGWTTRDEGNLWADPDPSNLSLRDAPPDPFTDANDDYAVLEWMREQKKWNQWHDFCDECPTYSFMYQIGDYARAALKVLE